MLCNAGQVSVVDVDYNLQEEFDDEKDQIIYIFSSRLGLDESHRRALAKSICNYTHGEEYSLMTVYFSSPSNRSGATYRIALLDIHGNKRAKESYCIVMFKERHRGQSRNILRAYNRLAVLLVFGVCIPCLGMTAMPPKKSQTRKRRNITYITISFLRSETMYRDNVKSLLGYS